MTNIFQSKTNKKLIGKGTIYSSREKPQWSNNRSKYFYTNHNATKFQTETVQSLKSYIDTHTMILVTSRSYSGQLEDYPKKNYKTEIMTLNGIFNQIH